MQVFSVLTFALAVAAETYFEEGFDGDWESRWTLGKPSGKEMGKWTVTPGKWFVDEDVNKGLAPSEDMRFYSITSKMAKKSTSVGKPLVLQFSAKIENHQYAFCGGGYIKLLPEGTKVVTFGGDDDYHIMFGPDLCGCAVAATQSVPLSGMHSTVGQRMARIFATAQTFVVSRPQLIRLAAISYHLAATMCRTFTPSSTTRARTC